MPGKAIIKLKEKDITRIQKLTDYMYYAAVFIYFLFSIISSSMFMVFLKPKMYILIMAGMLGILILREMMYCLFIKKYDIREIIGLGICILFWYIAEKNDSSIMMCMFMLIFGSRNVDLNKTFRIIIPITIAVSVAAYWAAGEGYILNYNYIEDDIYRHSFGYCYPLILPCYIMNIAMLTAIMRKEKATWTEIGLLILFGAIFYKWCKAELSGCVTIVVALVMLLVKVYPGILASDFILWKVVDRIAVVIYPLCTFISLWFTFHYDESVKWMYEFNDVIGGRLYFQSKGFLDNGFKILGQYLFFVGAGIDAYGEKAQGEYNYVDNIYISILLRYGILFSVIAIILLSIAMYYCYQKNMRIWLWMLALWALHGLFEDKMHLVYYNSLLLIIGQALQNVKIGTLIKRVDGKKTKALRDVEKVKA